MLNCSNPERHESIHCKSRDIILSLCVHCGCMKVENERDIATCIMATIYSDIESISDSGRFQVKLIQITRACIFKDRNRTIVLIVSTW